jgi:hypothetical protein
MKVTTEKISSEHGSVMERIHVNRDEARRLARELLAVADGEGPNFRGQETTHFAAQQRSPDKAAHRWFCFRLGK